jgi:hypothetical protein
MDHASVRFKKFSIWWYSSSCNRTGSTCICVGQPDAGHLVTWGRGLLVHDAAQRAADITAMSGVARLRLT